MHSMYSRHALAASGGGYNTYCVTRITKHPPQYEIDQTNPITVNNQPQGYENTNNKLLIASSCVYTLVTQYTVPLVFHICEHCFLVNTVAHYASEEVSIDQISLTANSSPQPPSSFCLERRNSQPLGTLPVEL